MHRVAELARQLRGAAHDCERSAAVCDEVGARDCPSAMRTGASVQPASAEAQAPAEGDAHGTAAAVAHFREHGYARLPGLLDADQVRRLQSAFRREQAALDLSSQRFADIPRAVESDEVYLELLDSERVGLFLQQTIGSDAQAVAFQARTVPSEPEDGGDGERSDSYTGCASPQPLSSQIRSCAFAIAEPHGFANWVLNGFWPWLWV